jgi:signal transduction histidine kinase
MKVVIAFVILLLFSLIMSRRLQQPLDRLREASHRLAQGDFSVDVVSELKSNTREFNELANDFDHMTQEIKSLGEKQRRLIRDVSHELRTPLARQNLVLHLLRNSVEEKSVRLIDRLENETKEMNDLVGEILEYSRLENARYDADVTSMNVEHYCSLLVSEMQHDLNGDQALEAYLSNQTPSVNLDERLVLRVMRNIIGNAIKYAGPKANIVLSTYFYEKTLAERYTVISIEDDGPGIPDEQISSVFNPFTRLESARDKKSGGYGLGLAIVKESMAVMNGIVTAENKSEGGLRINLMFPIQPDTKS